ncbi:noncanonical pyrimidine nucleotidase, YjjG family [Dokdonia sinensis]|uniref:Noncanonical pyrimidine nucleotidase, YjjG family n=1 Tax=Dokdonia sinensis TaxID=2479847 RepID=A0A3M0GD67_9FLAO|nr:YjjG family noncanonical pyrimidine nucleotidase [Dokdonia sinensis]RMB62815.1 noncanonical pyrimidine nucleotidase, YjjG family [Dokdonia sinensis]
MLKNIEHVFFDLDHTLWDFDKNSGYAYAKIFSLHNIEVDLKQFLKIYEPINFQYWKWYREERVTKKQLRYGRLKKSFDTLKVSLSDDLINTLAEDYITYLPDNNHLFDGATELLEYLKQKYELHIITNGFEEVQTKKLVNSKIDYFFNTVTTSESAGVKKPNPKVFHKAMNDAGAVASSSVMIGDTYEADILGAIGVGMPSICFNYHKAILPKEQLFVDHLLEIKKYL